MNIIEVKQPRGLTAYINPSHVIRVYKGWNGNIWITLSNEECILTSFSTCREAVEFLKRGK